METWKERGKYFLKEMKDPYYKGVPGEYAFFLMMSVIPLLIITAQVLAFFSLSMDVFEEFIGEPTFQLKEILAPVLQFGSVKSLGVMSLLSSLWAASKMQFSMIRVNRYAFGLKEKYFGLGRIWAVVSLLLIIISMALSLILLVYGQKLAALLDWYMMKVFHRGFQLDRIFYSMRWIFSVGIFILLSLLLNISSTMGKVPVKRLLPGSIFSALSMLIATGLYSIYIERQSNYNLLYGSMSSLIILLFWFFILGTVFLWGTVVNKSQWEYEKDKARKTGMEKKN